MQITLRVENLGVKLDSASDASSSSSARQVLSNICAHVKPGQILAVMGPSGSGKTTLLSALSGRLKSTGRILLNGTQLNKSLRRQICYVLQSDIFFPNLTLRQTLVYTAMLRLPDSMSHELKMRKVDQVIEALDLKSCQHTIVGDFMKRGLSGGEKKRCSIACELLSNPSVMMLDEPTSSLDSCTALKLIKLLKDYAVREQKTIIMSIHQPASQIFYHFDKLLLLSQGQMMYFGSIQQVLPFFNHFNYYMQHVSYNPADFLMEISKQITQDELNRLSIEAREAYFSMYKRNSQNNISLSSGSRSPSNRKIHQLQPQFVPSQDNSIKPQQIQHHHQNNQQQEQHCQTQHSLQTHQVDSGVEDLGSSIHSSWSKIYIYEDHDDAYSYDDDYPDQYCYENRWPSSFFTQLYALSSRNFIDAKARMLSRLNWIQTVGLALIAGAVWFQTKRTEETLNDIKGWMYFSTMYWMMFALFNTITSFPGECQVINKERLAGTYRLSAYYIAKMIGELPLVIALPSAFHMISYPLLGYYNFDTFISMWGIVILNSLAAQSVGMFIGFSFGSLDLAITIAALYSTSTMLFAGFYANTIPVWLNWLRYGSLVYYGYLNMQIVEFRSGPKISCAIHNSKYPSCLKLSPSADLQATQNANNQLATTSNSNLSNNGLHLYPAGSQIMNNLRSFAASPGQAYIADSEILIGLDPSKPTEVPNPIWFNTLCLVVFLIIFRLLGYVILRRYHKPL